MLRVEFEGGRGLSCRCGLWGSLAQDSGLGPAGSWLSFCRLRFDAVCERNRRSEATTQEDFGVTTPSRSEYQYNEDSYLWGTIVIGWVRCFSFKALDPLWGADISGQLQLTRLDDRRAARGPETSELYLKGYMNHKL